jgi:hypothetical protein
MKRDLLAIALLITNSVTAIGKLSPEEKRAHLLQLRTEHSRIQSVSSLDRAYLDALQLLEQPGPCGFFFGGRDARVVLESLVVQMQESRLSNSRVGVRMSGQFTLHQAEAMGITYRMFETVELNTIGPFNRAKVFPAEPHVPGVGAFRPNTRQARVLILLHELAHLIRQSDGKWLIQDDGDSARLSRKNTKIVEERCGAQIRAL